MAKPQLGNATVTFKETILPAKEYRLSGFLQFNNGWDDQANLPVPMTADQEAIVANIHKQMLAAGIELQVTIQEKAGDDYRNWKVVGRPKLHVNQPEQQAAPAARSGDFS